MEHSWMGQFVSSVWGREAADALAAWAIDALCYPPADIRTPSTLISASEIRRGRAILEEFEIDWRKLKGDARSSPHARS